MNISNLFSDEKINTGRQVELDIVKALSIIFMIFSIHFMLLVFLSLPLIRIFILF